MAEGTPQEIKPVAGKIAIEAGTNAPKGKEAQVLAKGVENLSLITIDVAAGGEVPPGMKDNLFIAFFGEKTASKVTDPVLKPLALGLSNIISQIENNIQPGIAGATHNEIDAAIVSTIRSNEGWKKAFELMDPTKQNQLIKTIRETGATTGARRLYVERMIIAQESGGYEAEKRKYEEIAKQTKQKTDERDAIDKQIKGKDRAKIVADKDARALTLESLINRKQSATDRKDKIEARIDELSSDYREKNPKTGVVTFNKTGRDADPDIKKLKTELNKIDNEINGTGGVSGLDAQIIAAQAEVTKADKLVQSFDRHDSLTTDIGKLSEQLTNAEASLITARTAFANKINELVKSLNGVLPEAAKEAMNKFKSSIDSANVDIAKQKAEEAAKAGDIITGAEANVEMYYLQAKYIKDVPRVSSKLADLFLRNKGIKEQDKITLRADFLKVLQNDGRGAADLLKADADAALTAGKGAGLSPEQIKYFKDNPKAYAKFIEQAKTAVFKAVSRQSVLHLDITETDMKTLIGSPDFAKAAEQAVGDAQSLAALKEKIAGAGLKGGTWKEIGAKLSKPAMMGLLIMLLALGAFFGIKSLSG